MAKSLEVAISTYRTFESDMANPKTEVLVYFQYVGISADWIIHGDGEMLLADRGQAPAEPEDSNEIVRDRAHLFDLIVGMERQAADSGVILTPEQHGNAILFMTDLIEDGKLPKMTPRIQRQMMKLIAPTAKKRRR